MKTLQKHFTTPEQSKRLLKLGVPADSADCFYSHYIKTYAHSEHTEILWHRPRFITEDNNPDWNARLIDGTQTYLPCWSVGRLIEIALICHKANMSLLKFYKDDDIVPPIQQVLHIIHQNTKFLDFSKLEE